MAWYWIVLIVITAILLVAAIALYFVGKKAEGKKSEQDELMKANAQTVSMLIIDKKMLRMKDSGLPQAVIDQTPWYLKRSKTPVVKAKAGPQIITLLCAPEIYDDVPVKKEVKAVVSGLYLTGIKGLHGKKEAAAPKKKGWYQKLREKAGM